MDISDLAAIGIVTMAGLVRGTTGFGGAMLMTPMLSILFGPVPADCHCPAFRNRCRSCDVPGRLAKSDLAHIAVPYPSGVRNCADWRLFFADRRAKFRPENNYRRGYCIQLNAAIRGSL